MLVIFEMLASQKTNLQQNSLRKNWMPEQVSRLLFYATGLSPWLLKSTSFQLYLGYFRLLSFIDCLGIQSFTSPLRNTAREAILYGLLLPLQHLCILWDAMLGHWSPGASQPSLTQGIQGFPQGWQASKACASAQSA